MTLRRKVLLMTGAPLGGLIVLLSAVALIYYHQLTASRKRMTPMQTQQVFDGVYVVRAAWYNNFWVHRTSCGLMAFDSGLYPEVTKSELAKVGLDPADVKLVFLTHSDNEHAGGVVSFPNARVYLSRQEVQLLDGTTNRVPWPVSLLLHNRVAAPFTVLEDNQDVDFCGLKVRGVLVPGHTPGSMVYVVGNKVFTGDAVGLANGRAVAFNDFLWVNVDPDRAVASLPIMASLTGVQHVLTMHYGYSQSFAEAFSGVARNKP